MKILLLNDTLFRDFLEDSHDIRACGPEGLYIMPNQDKFEFTYKAKTELDITDILDRLGSFKPDVILHSETSTNYFYRGIEKVKALTIWRTIDNHIHLWQPRYATTHDIVCVAQKDYLPSFEENHNNAFWLPLHCFPSIHGDQALTRDIDVAFVGSVDPVMHPKRVIFLNSLTEHGIRVQIFSKLTHQELSTIYNRSKIVINQCINNDLNFRVFEAMANGAMLLTPWIKNGQMDLFTEGRDLITYESENAKDAAKKCLYYLTNEEERSKISKSGQHLVLKEHTLEKRVQHLFDYIEKNGDTALKNRNERINSSALQKLIPVFTALHTQGYASLKLAEDAIDRLSSIDKKLAVNNSAIIASHLISNYKFELAEPFLNKANNWHPSGVISGLLGRVHMSQGNLESAEKLLEQALITEKNADFMFWLALCYDGNGNRFQAMNMIRECLKLNPNNQDAKRLSSMWNNDL